jgi:hypothetical protein
MTAEPMELSVGRAVLQRFREYNEARHGEKLRACDAIKAVIDTRPGQSPTARQARSRVDWAALGIPVPKLRTMQRYLKHVHASHVGLSQQGRID